MHQAGAEVYLSVQTADGEQRVRVRTLRNERKARYRDWVGRNRDYVREASGGRAGYIHIPDMGPRGFAEFHRHFLRDYDCDGLIVDVRYNGGGHVSQFLLEKLCRQRLGAFFSRWSGVFPSPDKSPAGPMVALTNEFAGSDGDVFSHTFKMRKAGPLIGRRTWGGVIGISAAAPSGRWRHHDAARVLPLVRRRRLEGRKLRHRSRHRRRYRPARIPAGERSATRPRHRRASEALRNAASVPSHARRRSEAANGRRGRRALNPSEVLAGF